MWNYWDEAEDDYIDKKIEKIRKKAISKSEWQIGTHIIHKTFGKGVIRDVRLSASQPSLDIYFDSVGIKTVLASFIEIDQEEVKKNKMMKRN
jgi:hypothetical protein